MSQDRDFLTRRWKTDAGRERMTMLFRENASAPWSAADQERFASLSQTTDVEGLFDLRGIDLSGTKLDRYSGLAGSRLEFSDFSNGVFLTVSFHESIVSDCNFLGAEFVNAAFLDAILARSNFTGAKLVGCSFGDAKLADAVLDQALFENCDMCRTDLLGVRFDGAQFKNVNFSGARIHAAERDKEWAIAASHQCNMDDVVWVAQ